MGVTKRAGRVLKPLVNFPKWMGLRQLLDNFQNIRKMLRDLKMHRPVIRKESFEEAVTRMHLTEEDIHNRKRSCWILSWVYSLITILLFIYSTYLLFHLIFNCILGFLITALMAVFAYRESFWYFQMKTKSLGNNFQDWVRYILRGGRK